MDQIKIGKFIAGMRKEQMLTQRQLGDKLGISDKTVSKWECGKGLPEVSLMIPLCEILQINVNELLSGEKLTENNYSKKAEENMINLIEEKQESKKKIILSLAIAFICISMVVLCVMVAGLVENMPTALRIFLIAFGAFIMIMGICVCIVIDIDTGTFECTKCGNRFKPNMKSYVCSVHTVTRRRLKCPKCGETTFCKRRLTR